MKKLISIVLLLLASPAHAELLEYSPITYDSGGGTPGGSTGQVQYNAGSGNFGGLTLSGDCTLVYTTGVITCLKTNGTAFGSMSAESSGNVTITGGAIDGTVIGGSTPAAGTFTTATTTALGKFVGTESVGSTFTIASGCGSGGTAPSSLTGGAATGSFVSNTTGCVPVITLPTAAHGWWCSAVDLTHTGDTFIQTATSTASCTISSTVTSGDTVLFHAEAY